MLTKRQMKSSQFVDKQADFLAMISSSLISFLKISRRPSKLAPSIRVNKMASDSVVIFSDVIDGSAEIINKPELLEVINSGSYKHISLLNNVVDEEKISITMENSNETHSEANNSEIELFRNQKFDEIFIANTKKNVNKTQ